MSVRARTAARRFVLAALLALGAGEARAAVVCSDTPGPNDRIYCARAVFTNIDIGIDLTNRAIATSGDDQLGVYAYQRGSGAISIGMTGGSIATTGERSSSISGYINQSANGAAIAIGMTRGSVNTSGLRSRGIYGVHTGTGRIAIDMTSGSISTTGERAHGIEGYHRGAGGVDIDMRGGSVMATGERADGVYGIHTGTGGIDIDVTGGSIATKGARSQGIIAWIPNAANEAAIAIGMTRASVDTSGLHGHGIHGVHAGAGRIGIDMTSGSISTTGGRAHGIEGYHTGAGGIDIAMRGGSIATTGASSRGIIAWIGNAANAAAIAIGMTRGSVDTSGSNSHGIYGVHLGRGGIALDMTGGSVTVAGGRAYGIFGYIFNAESEAAVAIDVTGGTVVGEGLFGYGAYGAHNGLGSASLTTGAQAKVKAPFSIGAAGRLANAENAAGRLVIAHGGAVEARNIGLRAWAIQSSGHTFGAGAQTADGAARTEPMIAVVSSGTVSVGASVTDAFVRDRIAGADETLSAAESAVLDAVAAGDSDALDTALAALPAAYDAAWKAEARNLLAKLAAEPSAAVAADRAADDILGLSRAGIRAAALSHHSIAAFVRQGDRDPAILAAAAEDRTPQQRAALAEQEKLSADERTVLAAILTGGDLTAALAALPAAYTDAWKDGVRRHAASYNAGGIRVDVTAGSIAAEGNGVEAFYAVPHDRNGAIAVTVAEGARVTGSRHGVHVRGAGAGAGNFRAQSVTVDGAAMGGTGAGVHMAGGGMLTVGANGEVGAASGVGVLADGAWDSRVTVAGRVAGDIRADGGGALTADVKAGGAVTGTIHNPASPMVVSGSVGRILYDNGGTVTVAGGGAVTGVDNEGTREAIRSDAGNLDVTVAANGEVTGRIEDRGAGNLKVSVSGAVTGGIAERGAGGLDVTVSGTVTGGVLGEGAGAHKVAVESAGAVTGTVRLHAGAETTVAGKVGRVRYDNGGAVTVNASGEIAGLEIDGAREAIRADAGDLAVTVHGTVTGNIDARGDGDLTVKVSGTGTVAGEIFGRGGGVHTIEIAEKAKVLGTVHNPKSGTTVSGAAGRVLFDNGGALTIAATGRIAGIDGEAIRADAGNLEVAVASGGAVAGRIEGRGAGAMTLNVSGAVTGAIHSKGAGKHEIAVASGGAVTGDIVDLDAGDLVASVAGRVTGDIEERGAGDLTATVTGTVTGGIRGQGAGSHTVAVMDGGAVAGAVRLSSGAMTVAGRVGRVLYDNGGSVTVAASGTVAGVETSDGGREAIRSAAGDLTVEVAAMGTVAGDIRGDGDGDLDVDVSGTVKGGIFGLGGGEHNVHVKSGGAVEGLIHLEASTVTVDGAAASVLFDRGGAVDVGSGGRLSGLDGRAVHSVAGDLTVDVNGVVTGSVSDIGPGNLAVTVANALTGDVAGGGGGMHRLTVLPDAVFKGNVKGVELVRVAGRAEGTLDMPAGGEATVPAGGVLVGAADGQSGRLAVVAETGALSMTVEGMVEGDVEARDAGAASTVTVGAGGEIDGKVALAGAGSTVAVDGEAHSIDITGGMVTVGENGRIEDETSGRGAMTIRSAADESNEAVRARVGRIGRGIAVCLRRVGEDEICLDIDADGRLAFDREPPPPPPPSHRVYPRHRVYEALPSVLLALNALPAHGDRFAAAGAPRGAFARFDAGGGDRRPASSTAASRHDYRRFAFEAGIEGAAGERGVFAVSVHHVRGRADVETDGGRVEITGTGARVSGAWLPAEDYYVSAQAAATLYEADLDSALEGALARDLSGRGYAAGVEAGRRLELGRVALTPRAGADWSMVEMSSFTDSVNERVSLDAGRRVAARAGLRAETGVFAGRVFATADVERELSGAMRATAADRRFEADAEATWLRLGLGGAHEWADGRIALRAAADYAAARNGNRDFSGSAALTVRF